MASANQQLSIAHATTLTHLENLYLELKRERENNSTDKLKQAVLTKDEADKPKTNERLEYELEAQRRIFDKVKKDCEVSWKYFLFLPIIDKQSSFQIIFLSLIV